MRTATRSWSWSDVSSIDTGPASVRSQRVTDRWATFDCYGTLIDWNGGIVGVIRRLWPDADVERVLRRYHALEPLVQEGRALRYREVGARTLRALAALEGLPVRVEDEYAFADTLPEWPVFAEVPASLTTLKQRGWHVAILSNTDPDLLAASIERIGVPVDLTITAAEAGSYKPAHGHWARFFERSGAAHHRPAHGGARALPLGALLRTERPSPRPPRARGRQSLPRSRPRRSARPARRVDQSPGRA